MLGREDALRLLALHHRPAHAVEPTAAEVLVEEFRCHPKALTLLARSVAMAVSARPYASAPVRIGESGALAHIEGVAERLLPQLGGRARKPPGPTKEKPHV